MNRSDLLKSDGYWEGAIEIGLYHKNFKGKNRTKDFTQKILKMKNELIGHVQNEKELPNMRNVAKDIINLKFDGTENLQECRIMFYDVMRKHGIKQTMPHYNDDGDKVGRISNNFEWTMSRALFLGQVQTYFDWEDILGDSVPEDVK